MNWAIKSEAHNYLLSWKPNMRQYKTVRKFLHGILHHKHLIKNIFCLRYPQCISTKVEMPEIYFAKLQKKWSHWKFGNRKTTVWGEKTSE
jgi:hypothetical protein